ncbi:cadherin-related family member 3-like [Pleurodeles waltl]|uniref:cadherin-related family member 3-like n=1 Tax=Pleurodeles waltl TaxID=8319 RepID=UPI0037097EA1
MTGAGLFASPTIEITPRSVSLPENAAKNEKVPATINTTSVDGPPVIINANPVEHPFRITPKMTNEWELITTGSPGLDFETVPLYSLQILVKDKKGNSASELIDIRITDVNEAPVFTGALAIQGAEVYIAENTPVGTSIYRVAASDPEKDVLEYSLENISPGDSTAFTIDNNGAISTAETFDYDAGTKSYTLTIKVSDGVLSINGNVKVFITNVNDNDPVLLCTFSSISDGKQVTKNEASTTGFKVEIELYEERPIGTTVATCTATDADQMNDLTFRLDPGNPYFTVNRDTGTVIISSKMDAEEIGFISVQSFSEKVCDKDLKCASIPVTVKILGINDNPPICDQYLYSYANPEIIPGDTIVATLICQDPDEPPNVLTYEPHSGPVGDGQLFQQIPDTPNVIQVKKALTYDSDLDTTYEIMVSVSDERAPPHTVTTTIIVSVTPVNNFSPEFVAPETYIFTVPETSGGGYVVGTVKATDEDKPPCVRYRITSGDTEIIKLFWINRDTGVIELTTNPDYETTTQYTLAVEAADCDPVTPKRKEATVKVNIKEENDEAPVCLPSSYSAIILDNVTAGMNINSFKLHCKDRDSNDTAMRFEIVSGNVNNHFTFDPTRGSHSPKLIVKNPFNFEDGVELQRKYSLVVHIIDDNLKNKKEARAMTGSALIDINVIRSNPPSVPPTTFEMCTVNPMPGLTKEEENRFDHPSENNLRQIHKVDSSAAM